MKQQLIDKFCEQYGDGGDIRAYFAPGRVNLIGEHTDYNGGHVFPCALTIGTYAIVRKRTDDCIRFCSTNFIELGIIESSLLDLDYRKNAGWTNYPKGMIWTFAKKGYKIDSGFDMLIYGNIPNASGLSSSASVEVVTGVMLRDIYGFSNLTNLDIALIAQESENKYNGLSCGIMDQFAVAMGKADCAMFLDTATLDFEYVPVKMDDCKLVIACSNKKRGLVDSKYNERRAECEEALRELQSVSDIKSLGELTCMEYDELMYVVKSEVRQRRAKHAVYENHRTIQAVEALQNGDIKKFGQLMNESHVSLRDDYEVTGIELDTLVEAAWKQEGVIGSRMTGAGFGGCTVSIVKSDCIDSFISNVGRIYKSKIGYSADFYAVSIGDGGKVI